MADLLNSQWNQRISPQEEVISTFRTSKGDVLDICMWLVVVAFTWLLEFKVMDLMVLFVVIFVQLQPHGLQHTRLPCSSLSPGIWLDSCPLSPWCYLTISSSVFPFSSRLQSFPVSGSFPMSRLFASGGQNISFIKYILVSWNLLVLIATSQLWFNHHSLSPFEPMSCRL